MFIAGDLRWYPVEGEPRICQAPDTMVAFGRPKGGRGSYKQWEEGDIAPQVVLEIVSQHDGFKKMLGKLNFYEQYGVEEYYLYDEWRDNELSGWIRQQNKLLPLEDMQGWISPRLGIRFERGAEGLLLFHPDGKPFESYIQVAAREEELEKDNSQLARQRDLFANKLRQLGIDPDALQEKG